MLGAGVGLPGIFKSTGNAAPTLPINLFTENLILAENRTHDLAGNSVTFLKSNFEFRAADALTSTIGFRYRNLANNQNIFSIKNQGRVEINGSDALVLLGGTSYTAYWLTTPTAQMSMFNEGLNQVGFRQNTNNLLFQRGGGNAAETHSSITIANGSWNIGLNWAALTANLNIGMTTLDQARLGVQASDGNGANKTIVVRNHLNTGNYFEVTNSGDIIANGGSGNVNITSIGSASGKAGNVLTAFGARAGMSSLSGTENAFFGYNAGQNCSTGSYNLFAGANAGGQNNASGNVFLGSSAGANNTGSNNTIIGAGLAGWLGTGNNNTITGLGACQGLSSGSNNSSYGNLALANVGTGSGNVGIGDVAGALRGAGFSDTNLNPSESIFIGAYSKAQNSNQTNQIVIGLNAVGEGSNTARIGNSSVTELHVGGNGASLALKSPDGTTWRISVDNTGTLVIV